jgi:hypothetical protein
MVQDKVVTSGGSADIETKIGRRIFDMAVVVAVASAVLQFLSDQGEPGVRFVLLAGVMLITRWGNVPAPFAAAFAALMLLATWASVQHWYRDVVWADEVVHLLTPGSLAAAAYFLLAHLRVMPDADESEARLRPWTPIFWVTLVGVFAAVLWEFYEWVVEQVSAQAMYVGYTDTVSDLLAGMLGSMVAGVLALWWTRHHDAPGGRSRGN